MEKLLVPEDAPLKAGETYEMNFQYVGPDWTWWKATQIALFETSVNGKGSNYIQILGENYLDDGVIIRFRVRDNERVQTAGITVAVIAAVLVAGFIFLSFRECRIMKESDNEVGSTAYVEAENSKSTMTFAAGGVLLLLAGVIGWVLWRKR